MKALFIYLSIATVAIVALESAKPTKVVDNTRDSKYEQYCDSIWEADPIYYSEVLMETDEYQDYLEEHGKWW